MDKKKVGYIFTFLSLVPVVLSTYFFLTFEEGAIEGVLLSIFTSLSIVGIILAIASLFISKKSFILSIIGILANSSVLILAFLMMPSMLSSAI